MNTITTRPFPLPGDIARKRSAAPIFKAATALLLGRATRTHLKDVLKQHFLDDRNVEAATRIVMRAATAPASETVVGWAKDLTGLGVVDIVDVLGSASVFAILTSLGAQFRFDGTGKIQVSGSGAVASNASWIAELGAFPVGQYDLSPKVYLEPRKLGTISTFSYEALAHTTPVLEQLVRLVITESINATLDATLLDDAAGTTARPPGLRNNIVALQASASTGVEAMVEDASALIAAVSAVSSNSPIVIVASPAQAIALKLRTRVGTDHQILSSAALADGVVMAVAVNCLCSACDPLPRFQLANAATINFDNATPQDFAVNGVPAAGLTKSNFQTDTVSLRATFECSWGLRNSSGVAWITGVVW
jgi:hypothetical protein